MSNHTPAALPSWVSLLGQLRDECQACAMPEGALPRDAAAPIPFEDLLFPLIKIARARLRVRFSSAVGLSPLPFVSDVAYLALERGLLVQLANISGLSLLHEFDASLLTPRRTVLKLFGSAPGEPPRDGYAAFVERHLSLGWSEIFSRYPVMLRLFGVAIEHWLNASEEFLNRLVSDWQGLNLAEDQVARLSPAQSDPHHDGRTVIVLELRSGRKLVYKPKDLGLEAAFNELLSWCNGRGIEPNFKVATVHCRAGYGWSEYVEQLPCADGLAAGRYYRRAGALLGVLYLLQATDCHRENLIAHGEYPVLIDAETLLYPTPRAPNRSAAVEAASAELRAFLGSVIGTGMLPRWDVDFETRIAFDISALGCVEPPLTPSKVPRIANENSDDMRVLHEHVTQPLEKNVPRLNGAPLFPDQYSSELCDGFAAAYRLFLRERSALLAPEGALVSFKGLEARFLVRNTRVYHQLLGASFYPQALRSGVVRSLGFERLASDTEGFAASNAWPILKWELDALENLDVPCFNRSSNGVDLTTPEGGTLSGFFEQSGFDRALARVARLDESDLAYQQAIIRSSLLSARVTSSSTVAEDVDVGPPPTELSPESTLEEARRLGEEILERAHRQADGRLSWLGLAYLDLGERCQLQPVGENLYEGRAGVAIFLAALALATGEARFAVAAQGALQLARKLWRDPPLGKQMVEPEAMGIGGVTGVASLSYALATVANLLDDPSLLDDALGTARLIDVESVRRDRQLDVMSGAAGALLCLLSVHEKAPEPELLLRATACGEHLLSQLSPVGPDLLGWPRPGKPALTGFSHGAAGIGLSLARLYGATGEPRYLRGAQSALAFERAHFSAEAGNWPDLRLGSESAAPPFMTSWCHGAVGIGLSRIAYAKVLDERELLGEIAAASETALGHSLLDLDHLCCGNLGRLELLAWSAAREPKMQARVASTVAELVLGARRRGGYRLFHGLPPAAWNPGFFRGVAGIGYSLLRRVMPERLPNVLTLD